MEHKISVQLRDDRGGDESLIGTYPLSFVPRRGETIIFPSAVRGFTEWTVCRVCYWIGGGADTVCVMISPIDKW